MILMLERLFFMSRSLKFNVRSFLCKSVFYKYFWKLSGDEFWVLTRFCSSKTDRVTNFWLSGILSGQFGKNLGFWLTHFFDQLIFWQLIYVTTDFLTTKFCDSLSNYLTYLLRVWDSRPLVLFSEIIWPNVSMIS